MWANAKRDGRPVQRRKVWLTPTTRVPCSNPLKFAGVPQTRQQISAVIVGRRSPYYQHMWRR